MGNAANAGDAVPAAEANVGNLLNIDVNALPGTAVSVPAENAQQLALQEFVGQWQLVKESRRSGDDLIWLAMLSSLAVASSAVFTSVLSVIIFISFHFHFITLTLFFHFLHTSFVSLFLTPPVFYYFIILLTFWPPFL